jgi:hypothetical protein
MIALILLNQTYGIWEKFIKNKATLLKYLLTVSDIFLYVLDYCYYIESIVLVSILSSKFVFYSYMYHHIIYSVTTWLKGSLLLCPTNLQTVFIP